ncbi:hypothetical protein WAE59_24130 [Pedobacter sp. GR22-6]
MSWQNLRAQEGMDVIFGFESDTVFINSGQSFSNKLLLENRLDRAVTLKVSGGNTKTQDGLISIPPEITLAAKEKKAFPVKYMADRKTILQQVQAFSLAISGSAGIRMASPKSFYTKLRDQLLFSMSSDQTEYYLDQNTNETRILLRARNLGLVAINFRVLLSEVPEGLEFTGEMGMLSLQPGAQQVIPFVVRNRASRQVADYVVTIQAVDPTNRQLSLSRIRIMSLSHVRRFGAGNPTGEGSPNNTFALRYVDMNQNSSFYQLQASGQLNLEGERKLEYRFNLDHYQDIAATSLYDTYLDYQEKDWGIKLGNVYDNFDYAINGRGLKANFRFRNGNVAEVFGVQNNFLLYSRGINTISGANIAGANYKFVDNQEDIGQISYLHSSQKFYGLLSDQLSGKTRLRLNELHEFNFEAGYSQEKSRSSTAKQGLSAGLNYNFNKGNFNISSINYYSTPYYTGLRRGLLQSDTRIMRMAGNGSHISARVSLLKNRPEYQLERGGLVFRSNKSVIDIYELGYGFRKGIVSLDFRPYFMKQNLENNIQMNQFPNGVEWNSSAARIQFNANLNHRQHSLSFYSDYGYVFQNTANRPNHPFHSFKLNANYSNPIFGLSSYLQLNPYYLSDALSTNERSNYQLYSIGPNTKITAFKNQLNAQLSAMYNYYGFSQSKNYTLTANMQWRIKGNWFLTTDVFYTLMKMQPVMLQPDARMDPINFSNRQIRLGLQKQFKALGASEGKKLQLRYFLDANNNGIKDENELDAAGVTIRLNNEAAVTNKQGMVRFYNLEAASYNLYTLNNTGWGMLEPVQVVMTKNKSVSLPLVKTLPLTGQLILSGRSYADTAPTLSGIMVFAKDASGKKYKTLTDAEGRYAMQLPPNDYTVYIETSGMPFAIKNVNNKISLNKEGLELNFDYRDERRKVELKRF